MLMSAGQNYKKEVRVLQLSMRAIENYNVGFVVLSFMIIKYYDCGIKLLILMSA